MLLRTNHDMIFQKYELSISRGLFRRGARNTYPTLSGVDIYVVLFLGNGM